MTVSPIEAYSSLSSVAQGRKIAFHARAWLDTTCKLTIKQHSTGIQCAEVEFPVNLFIRNSSDLDGAAFGCNWPLVYEIKIPQSWPSDLYIAEFTANGGTSKVPFIVRSREPNSPILVKVSDTTAQAYNNWGGQSLYNREPMAKTVQISFDRPWVLVGHKYDYWWFELRYLEWLRRHNIEVDCCSSVDLHSGDVDLSEYNLLLSIGHDEYWSKEMRDRVEKFVRNGGHVCFFGGNTCFWQVRFDRNCRQMIGYKEIAKKDPMVLIDPSRVSGIWSDPPTNRPENEMTCVSYRNGGGWWDVIPEEDHDRRYKKTFRVTQPEHWVFEGTGLNRDDTFGLITNPNGTPDTIIGHETDGARFVLSEDGTPVVTGEDGTPKDAVILAYADLTDWPGSTKNGQSGNATMIIRELEDGGAVFTASTVNWGSGLTDRGDSPVDLITLNLLNKLKSRNTSHKQAYQRTPARSTLA